MKEMRNCWAVVGVAVVVVGCDGSKPKAAEDAGWKPAPSTPTTAAADSDAAVPDGGAAVVSAARDAGPALPDFEGEITLHMTGKSVEGKTTFIFTLKRGKAHLQTETPGKPTTQQLFLPSEKRAYTFDAAQRKGTYFFPGPMATAAPRPPPTIEKKGLETNAGIECMAYKLNFEAWPPREVCAATERSGLGWFESEWITIAQPAIGAVRDVKGFPLRIVEYDRAGAEVARIDVYKVERKKIEDSFFTIPAGFKVDREHY